MRLLPRIERACLCLDEEGEHEHIWMAALVWGRWVVRIPEWVDDYLIPKFAHHAFIDEEAELVGVTIMVGWMGRGISYTYAAEAPGVNTAS